MIRELLQRLCTRWLDARTAPFAPEALRSNAIVFAPHPDDETLGCGGTIGLKRAAGARVSVVFMTDGTRSHASRIDAGRLGAEREHEAVEACAILGVPRCDVQFFRFPDGRLVDHHAAAVSETARVLQAAVSCEQVFVPYRADGSADHEATFRIVSEAVAQTVPRLTMLEYTVWAWGRWPWVDAATLGLAGRVRAYGSGASAAWRMRQFGLHTDVASVMDKKKRALAAHRTQMLRRDGDPRWMILSDVHDGEFLNHLLRPREIFRASIGRTHIGQRQGTM